MSLNRQFLICACLLLWFTNAHGQLSATITTTQPTCKVRSQPTQFSHLGNGSITAVASGGTPPYQYTIDPGYTTQNNGYFPNVDAGNYVIIVTDAAGNRWQSPDIFLAYTKPSPYLQLNVLNKPSSCTNADGAIQLVASGGTPPYTYSWDGGQTYAPTPTVMTNLQQGYGQNFLVRDANGCLAGTGTSSARFTSNYFMCFACC